MKHIASILVIANRSMQHSAAIRHGREIAKTTGASLQLVLFDFDALIEQTADWVSPAVMELARAQFEQQRVQWLASEAAVMAADGIQADCDFVWAPELYEAVIAKCLQLKPDLVIKDAPGKDKEAQDADYEPNRKLFRYCPVPLMLVRPDSPDLPHEVLAAVDVGAGSDDRAPLNDMILTSAQAMAAVGRGHVHLAHSFPFGEPGITSRLELRRLHAEVRDSERGRFEAYADRHNIHRDRRHLIDGAPHRMLPALVNELHAQLLVVGSNYRSTFDRFVLGSTVERLIAHPPCDLLMVRGEGFMTVLERHLDIEDIQTRYGLDQGVDPITRLHRPGTPLISPALI
ncbi:MAG: universal stress protein [Pseudomonadota bacterium]